MPRFPYVRLISGIISVAIVIITLPGCGNMSGTAGGRGCHKIGILLPDSQSSSRWEQKDYPALQAAIETALPHTTIDHTNANGSQSIQLSQAVRDLNQGDCILVVAAQDSMAASSIVQEAHQKGVPVIAYDRLINDATLDYYVSFNSMDVGIAQGRYIQSHYQKYIINIHTKNIVFISGSKTDDNALLYSQGVHQILDPLFSAGALSNQGETFTLDWDRLTAESEMELYLEELNNQIAIAYVANDDMAGTVIDLLTSLHLNGKILVTGQDASAAGIHEILLGNQAMTVYKPIAKEAQATAQLIATLSRGTDMQSLKFVSTRDNGGDIPTILLPVISVDKTNIATTVLADGFVTKTNICQGISPGTDQVC